MHAQDRLFCEIAVQLNLLTREQVTRCMQTQQREESGKNIASLAVALGFMNQSAVENVMQQQQRVLDRRREAREASRVQRDAESRAEVAAAHGPSSLPARGNLVSGRAVRREPTPTSRWVHSDAPPENRLRGEALANAADFLPPGQFDSGAIRETLDARPSARASARTAPGVSGPSPAQEAAMHAAAARASVPTERPHAQAPQAASAAPQPSAAHSVAPARSVGVGSHPAEAKLAPPAVRAPRSPSLGGLDFRSPAFTGAATSAPLASAPAPNLASATGTLLEGSGRAQAYRQAPAEPAPPARAASRPVPSGRDWRNPSRPPPPNAGLDLDLELSQQAALGNADSGPMSLPLDLPHYVQRALALCIELGASDLHLHAGALPALRVDGRLRALHSAPALTPTAAERICCEVLDEEAMLQLSVDGELRCRYELPGARARLHAFVSELGLNLVLHLLPSELLAPERLGLGASWQALREAPFGLCVCSGPAGSGKTTTLWSLTQALASERALHVVSLECPLELSFEGSLGLCEQREVGRHVASYAEGIDWALAQAADVIVVADLLAEGALAASLRACRARCLVLAGVRASSSRKALASLLYQPQLDAEATRAELAHSLRFMLHQRLVPKSKVKGRIAAIEQLVNTPALAQLIRDDQLQQLPELVAASRAAGMVSLDDALEELVRTSNITRVAAQSAARSSERFATV